MLLFRLFIAKMYDVNSLTERNENISLNMQVDNSISNDNVNLLSSDIFNQYHKITPVCPVINNLVTNQNRNSCNLGVKENTNANTNISNDLVLNVNNVIVDTDNDIESISVDSTYNDTHNSLKVLGLNCCGIKNK